MNRVFLKKLAGIVILVPLLGGCWNAREMEHMFYSHALGVDFVDGQFVVYAQILNFASLGKQGSKAGSSQTESGSWVGMGAGTTFQSAVHKLYNGTHRRIYWGHTSALVLSQRVLEKNYREIIDQVTRYNEFRYSIWIFGTQGDVKKVLQYSPISEISPVYSQLGDPTDVYDQSSMIRPLRLFQFIIGIREHGRTAKLPLIALNGSKWSDNNHEYSALAMQGIGLFEGGKWQGALNKDNILGLRWLEKETVRTPLVISKGGVHAASLILKNPKPDIKVYIVDGEPRFDIRIRTKGSVVEMVQPIEETEIRRSAEAKIRDEIVETYKKGLELKSDLYQLMGVLYRNHPNIWRRKVIETPFLLTEASLRSVIVDVKIVNYGKMNDPFEFKKM